MLLGLDAVLVLLSIALSCPAPSGPCICCCICCCFNLLFPEPLLLVASSIQGNRESGRSSASLVTSCCEAVVVLVCLQSDNKCVMQKVNVNFQ